MELLTVKEVAAFLKVSKSLVYTLIARRQLRCVRIGLGRGTIRVGFADLERFVSTLNVDLERNEQNESLRGLTFITLEEQRES